MGLEQCRLIELPVVKNPQGNLAVVEQQRHVPFEIARVYYLYDVPSGAQRGGHAHRELEQLVIAMSGSFDITLDDGSQQRRIALNKPSTGLYLPPMTWRELTNFSSGAVCLVLASDLYDEGDYYRDYGEFQAAGRGG